MRAKLGGVSSNELFIGLMSGTSVDGIDAVLVEFASVSDLQVIATQFTPFDQMLRDRINRLAQSNDAINRRRDSPLHQTLATNYAQASLALLEKANVKTDQVFGIANHGQTVRHEPNATPAFSLQLGDPQLIADQTGITTYAQFRQADLALGGQGAPLMPAFHDRVLRGEQTRLILNIGGIANLTKLGSQTIGFDTGPGNTLLDQWVNKHLGLAFDEDGDWSRQGEVIPELLERLLSDAYFSLVAPKSTGPDYFNLDWLGDVSKYPAADVQATLLALTVRSIVMALEQLAITRGEIYLCGGGAFNAAMREDLERALPEFSVDKPDVIGVPSEWVEAVGFAWLGYCCKHNITSNLPSVTGARDRCVLGEAYHPRG